jgi:lysophospholipase L1-like esterase
MNVKRIAAWLGALTAATAAVVLNAAPRMYPRLPTYVHSVLRVRAILSEAQREPFAAIMVGDSIVEGAKIPRDLCGVNTLNAGVDGAKISDVARFAPSLLKAIHPQKTVFAIGVNDARVADPTSVEAFRQDYQRTIAVAREAGAKIYTATIAPIGAMAITYLDPARIEALNEIIRSLGVTVISLDALAGTDGLLPETMAVDGVHLRPSGYEVWLAAMGQGCKN